jgi:RNase P subunit RPR2
MNPLALAIHSMADPDSLLCFICQKCGVPNFLQLEKPPKEGDAVAINCACGLTTRYAYVPVMRYEWTMTGGSNDPR